MTKLVAGLAIITAALALWLLAIAVNTAAGTEDLGEPNLLIAACTSLSSNALSQSVTLTNCRQTAPPESADYGRTAVVHVKVYVKECPCWRTADVFLTKSLWQNNGFRLTD